MFTGIIETVGEVTSIKQDASNVHITVRSNISAELKIDQSVAHNGCCLTVVSINGNEYTVTAIQETLDKTNIKNWSVGTRVNLERCMQLGARLDGHIVQGHVDTTGICTQIENMDGSTKYTFNYVSNFPTVTKGSITVNGVSLTVVDSNEQSFSVCVIPYTLEHTNLGLLSVNDKVNLEFDIIGKYVERLMGKRE